MGRHRHRLVGHLRSGIDLFINAGPNSTHTPASVDAANAGLAVFCEKPLASSAAEAYQLWKAVERTGVMNRCACMHRFIPAIQLARQMVQSGELGEIRHYRSTFLLNMLGPAGEVSWRFSRSASGHGALGDLGSHHIDVARFLVAEVAEVAALTKTWTQDPAGAVTDINDDAFIAVGTLANGATATFQASRAATAHSLTSLIDIDGTKGSLSWGMERLNELTLREPGTGPRVLPVLQHGHPFDGFCPAGSRAHTRLDGTSASPTKPTTSSPSPAVKRPSPSPRPSRTATASPRSSTPSKPQHNPAPDRPSNSGHNTTFHRMRGP
jgi:predicted dehydrogenase